MRTNNRSLLALGALALLTGCDAVREAISGQDADGWERSSTQSAIDGEVLMATRDYRFSGQPAFFRVIVQCGRATGEVRVALESYVDEGNPTQYAASTIVTESESEDGPVIAGRLALGTLSGSRVVLPLAAAFRQGEHTNVFTWDPTELSLAARAASDTSAFWAWAASATGRDLSTIQFASQLSGAYSELLGAATDASAATQAALSVGQAVGTARLLVPHLRDAKRIAQAAPGAFLTRALPVTIDVANSGGRRELTIPARNPVVTEVLDACAGQAWWRDTPSSGSAATTTTVTQSGAPDTAVRATPSAAAEVLEAPACPAVTGIETWVSGVFGADTVTVCLFFTEATGDDAPRLRDVVVFRGTADGPGRLIHRAAGAQTPLGFDAVPDGPATELRHLWFTVGNETFVFEECSGRTCETNDRVRLHRFRGTTALGSALCSAAAPPTDGSAGDPCSLGPTEFVAAIDAPGGTRRVTAKEPGLIRVQAVPEAYRTALW